MKTTHEALSANEITAINYIASRHGRSWRRHAMAAAKNADLYMADRDMQDAIVSAISKLGEKGLAKFEPTLNATLAPSPTIVHAYRCGRS